MKELLTLILLLMAPLKFYSQVAPTDEQDFLIFPSTKDQFEPSIAIDKSSEPQNILIGGKTWSGAVLGYYFSLNNGIAWSGNDAMPGNSNTWGRSSVFFDANNRGHLLTISKGQIDNFYTYYTNDGGASWSTQLDNPKIINSDQVGYAKITADDIITSPYSNNVYITYSNKFITNDEIHFIKSNDRGKTFSNSYLLASTGNNYFPNIQTGPLGEIYTCWVKSTSGGNGGEAIKFRSSFDGGSNWTSEKNVIGYSGVNYENYPFFCNTITHDHAIIAVDKSCGSHNGRIYIVYTDFVGNDSKIKIIYSNDRGITWQGNKVISIQQRQNWMPWISVDDLTGVVTVAYSSLRENTNPEFDDCLTDIFVAYSYNGDDWNNIKVSDVPHKTIAFDNVTGYNGNHLGIASFNNQTYTVWTDTRVSGRWQFYCSKLKFNAEIINSSQNNIHINTPSLIANSRKYNAKNDILISNIFPVKFNNTSNIKLRAGNSIIFKPGFHIKREGRLDAKIANLSPCSTPGSMFSKKTLLIDGNKSASSISKSFINEVNIKENNLLIFPNPSKDFINCSFISSDTNCDVDLKIFDSFGRIVFETNSWEKTNNYFYKMINISFLPSGVYYALLKDKNILSSVKFIKDEIK